MGHGFEHCALSFREDAWKREEVVCSDEGWGTHAAYVNWPAESSQGRGVKEQSNVTLGSAWITADCGRAVGPIGQTGEATQSWIGGKSHHFCCESDRAWDKAATSAYRSSCVMMVLLLLLVALLASASLLCCCSCKRILRRAVAIRLLPILLLFIRA